MKIKAEKVFDTIAGIDREYGGDVVADWVMADLGIPMTVASRNKIIKVLKKQGYTNRGRVWVGADRKIIPYSRDRSKMAGARRLTLYRREHRTEVYRPDEHKQLKKMIELEYKTSPGFDEVDKALEVVGRMTGLTFGYKDFARYNIWGDDLQRARHTCLHKFSKLDNFNGIPYLTIASVLRVNLERMVNQGGVPSVRDVYNLLMNFDNSFCVAVGDWNRITKGIIERIDENSIAQPIVGVKEHRNPLKFKDSEDWHWGSVMKKGLVLMRDDIHSCRPPFDGSFEKLTETTEGRVLAKKLHEWVKRSKFIENEHHVAAAIFNAFSHNIDRNSPLPSDAKIMEELLDNGEYYTNYGYHIQ